MSDYQEKFLEAEDKAIQLVAQLEELKKSSSNYRSSAKMLEETHEKLNLTIDEVSSIAREMKNFLLILKQIDTQVILNKSDEINGNLSNCYSKLLKKESILVVLSILALLLLISTVLLLVLK
jgi:hypothetical protein